MAEPTEETIWRVDALLLRLPVEFVQTGFSRAREQVLDIPNFQTETVFASWAEDDGRSLAVHCWSPQPPRAGNPIRIVEEWAGSADGAEVRFARTDVFDGAAREVLVAWFAGAGQRNYRIVGSGWERGEFTLLVADFQLLTGE